MRKYLILSAVIAVLAVAVAVIAIFRSWLKVKENWEFLTVDQDDNLVHTVIKELAEDPDIKLEKGILSNSDLRIEKALEVEGNAAFGVKQTRGTTTFNTKTEIKGTILTEKLIIKDTMKQTGTGTTYLKNMTVAGYLTVKDNYLSIRDNLRIGDMTLGPIELNWLKNATYSFNFTSDRFGKMQNVCTCKTNYPLNITQTLFVPAGVTHIKIQGFLLDIERGEQKGNHYDTYTVQMGWVDIYSLLDTLIFDEKKKLDKNTTIFYESPSNRGYYKPNYMGDDPVYINYTVPVRGTGIRNLPCTFLIAADGDDHTMVKTAGFIYKYVWGELS